MTARRVAVLLLASLAVALGANMLNASSRFVTAYDTYDRIEMELATFVYVEPSAPVETTFVVRNPTRQEVEVIEIELSLNVGLHRVGGGTARPLAWVVPGDELATPVALDIFDRDYMQRRAGDDPDWRVSGRLMVRIDPGLEPEWIPFTVRYIPE